MKIFGGVSDPFLMILLCISPPLPPNLFDGYFKTFYYLMETE